MLFEEVFDTEFQLGECFFEMVFGRLFVSGRIGEVFCVDFFDVVASLHDGGPKVFIGVYNYEVFVGA